MLTPLKPLGTIDQVFEIDCVSDKDTRQAHIDSAVARGLPTVRYRSLRSGKLAIVASGPSVADYVDILKAWQGDNGGRSGGDGGKSGGDRGEIWAVNGAFHWLQHRGIKPNAFIGIDPEWFLKEYLVNPPEDATYYLAAQVHPQVFDHLAGKNIRLWFPADGEVRHPSDAIPVHGGSSCLGRAPNLAYVLGWREAHIFGGDSSFTHKTHVYGGELPANVVPAELNGQIFKTTRTMMAQACEFVEQMVEWAKGKEPLSVSLYGDGLMQTLYAQTLASGSYEQYLVEEAGTERPMNRKQRRALMSRRAA